MSAASETFFCADSENLVIFALDQQRYALRTVTVKQVIRMVAITALPRAPAVVQGIINVGGLIIPVMRMRERFGLPDRALQLSDHLILVRTTKRTVALAVDRVTGVITKTAEEVTRPERILADLEYVEGVVKLEDGLAFIHDLDAFLSLDEESALDQAMSA